MPRRAELDCTSVRDRLDPYLEDDLGRRETRRLRAHLETCPGCREELRLARKLRAALREGLPTMSCPPEVSERVLRIARAEAAEREVREGSPAREGTQTRLGRLVEDLFGRRSSGESGRELGRLKSVGRLAALALRPARRPAGRLAPLAVRPARRPAASDGAAPGRSWVAVAAALALVALLVGVSWTLWHMAGTQGPEMARSDEPASDERVVSPDLEGYSADEVARAERQARVVLAAVAAVGRDAGRTVQNRVLEDALSRPARQAVRGIRSIRPGSDPTQHPTPDPDAERRQP